MRIRSARPATWVRPARACGALRRTLPALVPLLLLAPLPGCRAELVPPGAPTPWPAESARRWQWQWQLSGPLDVTVEADVFLLDAVRTTSPRHRRSARVAAGWCARCESARTPATDPDAARFPAPSGDRPAHHARPAGGSTYGQWDTLRAGSRRPAPAVPG